MEPALALIFSLIFEIMSLFGPRPSTMRSQRDINLWRIPLLLSLGAVGLFGLTLIPDILDKYGYIHIPSWLTMGSIDDARAILSATMGATATVLALIFSVALLVLSMVATLFGPRLLYRFLQDWVTQVTIGMFMATFVYISLVFLVTHQTANSVFIPQISLLTSWVLVVASFGTLVYYSHRIATSIQNPDLVAHVAGDVYPFAAAAHVRGRSEGTGPAPDDDAILREASRGAIVTSPQSGYLQFIDHEALVLAAKSAGAKVILRFRPGQFMLRGESLASVCPKECVTALEEVIDRSVKIGNHRTLTQDCEFGVAQIVEIAIRALSPAVNDTFTGLACVDWLADVLLSLAESPPLEGNWYDLNGELRVWMPAIRLERLVKQAFDLIRQASTQNPAVLIRQLDTIRRIAPRMPAPAKQMLAEQAKAIRDSATSGLAALDQRDIERAVERAREAIGTDNSIWE
jgi:uncharacterized membrane protein